MKLGFQGWFLPQPYTGIGQHSIGLLRAIAKQSATKDRQKLEVFVPVPKRVSIKGIPSKWLHVLKPKWWIPHAGLRKWYWERAQVPAFFAKANPDWEYYPYPCPLPLHSPNLRAVTVHDLILWEDKRYATNAIKAYYYKLTRRALVQADHIFTVSKATHAELGIPVATLLPNAIPSAIPSAIPTCKLWAGPQSQPAKLPRLSYENALVYFGGYDIRKNVPALINAFKRARKDHPQFNLLMIGEPHHQSRFYPAIPEAEGVYRLGKLSDAQVYATLKSAFAFVHFSDSEGFNIPLLQAMAAGCPAIVKKLPVNEEVSNGTALFISLQATSISSQAASLSDKIKLLKNKKKRDALIKAQKQAARRYSWEKSAKTFLKVLNDGTRKR